MDGLKESKQAVGAATLTAVNNLAPPTVLAQASRLNFSTRLFNLLVTNIPGPQVPLYVLGRRLEDLYPVAFLPENHALAIAIMSYNGGIDFGLLGDYDALPDIDVVAEGIAASLAELLDVGRGSETGPRSTATPAQTGLTADDGGRDGFPGRPGAVHPNRPRATEAWAGGRHARQAPARQPPRASSLGAIAKRVQLGAIARHDHR